MTRHINIDILSAKERKLYDDKRSASQDRREKNFARGLCINENAKGTHGAATHGCRCNACYVVHRGDRGDANVNMRRARVQRREAPPPILGARLVLLPILYAEVA